MFLQEFFFVLLEILMDYEYRDQSEDIWTPFSPLLHQTRISTVEYYALLSAHVGRSNGSAASPEDNLHFLGGDSANACAEEV